MLLKLYIIIMLVKLLLPLHSYIYGQTAINVQVVQYHPLSTPMLQTQLN